MNIITLASGAGLWDIAWRNVGAKIILQCEIEEPQLSILKEVFPEAKHDTDIFKLTKEKMENEYGIKNIKDCSLVGGLCCQPFSKDGPQKGREKDTWMCDEIIRLTRECRPRFVVVENVTGFDEHPDGLQYIIPQMERECYTGQTLSLPARAFGAPHERQRVFCLFARQEGYRLLPNKALEDPAQIRLLARKITSSIRIRKTIPGVYNKRYIPKPGIQSLVDGNTLGISERDKKIYFEKALEIYGNGVEYETGYFIASTVKAINDFFYPDNP